MASVSEDGEARLENRSEIFALKLPVYMQRYNAVAEYVNQVEAKRVVDIGCAECSLLRALIQCPSVEELCGVDLDEALVRRSKQNVEPLTYHFLQRRFLPLTVTGYCGSIAQPCQKFVDYDLITMVEIIEHLYDETLGKVPAAIFGCLRPRAAIITTPNSDFNVLFPDMGTDKEGERKFRHWDHKFEWTRQEFETWSRQVAKQYGYRVEFSGIGPGVAGTEHLGCCSQMALFERLEESAANNQCANPEETESPVPMPCDYVEYDKLWSVNWPFTPRLEQIVMELHASTQMLARRAYDLLESLDMGEEAEDDVACQLTPVLREGTESSPCDCGYERYGLPADSNNGDAFGWSYSSSTIPALPSVDRSLPHACLDRIKAWQIPVTCLLKCASLLGLSCTVNDIAEAVEFPPEEGSSAHETLTLSEDRKHVVCPWQPPSSRRFSDSEQDDFEDEGLCLPSVHAAGEPSSTACEEPWGMDDDLGNDVWGDQIARGEQIGSWTIDDDGQDT